MPTLAHHDSRAAAINRVRDVVAVAAAAADDGDLKMRAKFSLLGWSRLSQVSEAV